MKRRVVPPMQAQQDEAMMLERAPKPHVLCLGTALRGQQGLRVELTGIC